MYRIFYIFSGLLLLSIVLERWLGGTDYVREAVDKAMTHYRYVFRMLW
jgi:hypothetical protein